MFFNNTASPDGSVVHRGAGDDGDAAVIELALRAMSGDVDRIVFALSVYDAATHGHDLSRLSHVSLRIVEREQGQEIARFEVPPETAVGTAVVLGEIFRNAGEWTFRAIGQGYPSGLEGIAREYGVEV